MQNNQQERLLILGESSETIRKSRLRRQDIVHVTEYVCLKRAIPHILLQVFLARLAGEAGTIRTRLEERLLRDVHSIAGNFVARSLGNT